MGHWTQPRWWRRLKWIVLGTAGVGVLALVAAWLAVQHIPGWYRPAVVREAEIDRVRNDFSNQYDRFSGALNEARQPFQYWVTQQQIGEWLAIAEHIWPLSRHWLPAMVSEPCVVLEPGAIRVAATYRSGSLSAVASARLLVDGRGDGVWVKLDSLQVGSLPLPVSSVREWLERLDAGLWPSGQISKYQRLPERLPPLTDLLNPNGMRLPNSFKWTNPKRAFWIYELKVEPDAIVATVEPLMN